jgi:hypothetical protein
MTSTRNRGRPKNPATLHREQKTAEAEKILRETAIRHPMSATERNEMGALIEALERWEAKTLEEYHVPPMKKELAYAAASIGDESLEGYEEIILKEYRQVVSNGERARAEGSNSNQQRAKDRHASIISEYATVIDRLIKQGRSKSSIADVIVKELRKLRPETPISARTVRRWIAGYQARKLAKPMVEKIL